MPRERLTCAALAALVAVVALLSGCASLQQASNASRNSAPVLDHDTIAARQVAAHLDVMRRLMAGGPAEQAEILATAQRDFDLAPTPAHELRLAMVLALPGHPGSDLERAQQIFREMQARPEGLAPAERGLLALEMQMVDRQLALDADNRRLQDTMERDERERTAAISRRLQTEVDENAKLRKELDDARAKLDAIANIERSLNERRPGPEGRTP